MLNVTERFSDRVANYVKFRPGYPSDIIALLTAEIQFASHWQVADVGSGTGKLTEVFLENANPVFAVEPNAPMRTAGEALLGHYPNFASVDGTAENTTIAAQSVDLIVAGQAFHWFNPEVARKEFRRILRHPNSPVVLIWNERAKSAFLDAYEQFLNRHSRDYREVTLHNVGNDQLRAFFDASGYSVRTLPNRQLFDLAGLQGRYASSSYALTEQDSGYSEAMEVLQGLFEQYAVDGRVEMLYETNLYYGTLRS